MLKNTIRYETLRENYSRKVNCSNNFSYWANNRITKKDSNEIEHKIVQLTKSAKTDKNKVTILSLQSWTKYLAQSKKNPVKLDKTSKMLYLIVRAF